MRVVYMGSPSFAVPPLLALTATHNVVGVFTRPDKPSGRGRELKATAVKEAASALGLTVHQPPTFRDPDAVALLHAMHPDVVCVAAYGLILPQDVLDIPRYGCVNVHASLLPRWRGAAPIQRSILAGDEVTGVSIMRMEAGLDTGPVAAMLETPVDGHTAETLTSFLALLGARGLIDVLAGIESGETVWDPQNDAEATYADKLSKSDVALAPTLTAADALRRVRASGPTAPCRVSIGGTALNVLRATPTDSPVAPGTVLVTKRALVLGMRDGAIALEEVRPQGRKAMDGASFARGARIETGSPWDAIREENS